MNENARATSHTAKLASRDMAVRGIRLLENAIERDFGITLQIGAELEFVARSSDLANCEDPTNPLGVEFEGKYTNARKAFFASSPVVTNIYKEDEPLQYEVVIGHESTAGAIRAAAAIDQVRKHINTRGAAYKVHTSTEATSPFVPAGQGTVCSGMHINISLWKAGKNLLQADGKPVAEQQRAEEYADEIVNAALGIQSETVLLHAPNEGSYKRFGASRHSPHKISNSFTGSMVFRGYHRADLNHKPHYTDKTGQQRYAKEGHYPGHIESRLAGADADPYQVVLATLAGVYAGLEQHYIAEVPYPRGSDYIPRSVDAAAERFSQSTHFKRLLNRLACKEQEGDMLGDNFCAAVLSELEEKKRSGHAAQAGQVRA